MSLCEAKHTPNLAKSFSDPAVNPACSKSVLNPNPSPAPLSPQEFQQLKAGEEPSPALSCEGQAEPSVGQHSTLGSPSTQTQHTKPAHKPAPALPAFVAKAICTPQHLLGRVGHRGCSQSNRVKRIPLLCMNRFGLSCWTAQNNINNSRCS